ncbi:uncharacterized protein LOC133957398 isoform X2 [Platichthys flesus]|uniref:uncharacterized protein LOC133957398 isoform X2 n=1 Tax=Platichthys flesus TaxID=8260 RepID=UPI002DBC3E7F|nr:uncharacterized protein LOC133957398 isoform X2 [Platichthys flesus]
MSSGTSPNAPVASSSLGPQGNKKWKRVFEIICSLSPPTSGFPIFADTHQVEVCKLSANDTGRGRGLANAALWTGPAAQWMTVLMLPKKTDPLEDWLMKTTNIETAPYNKPNLCLFSIKLIEVGTEIISYSGDSKGPSHEKVTNLQTPAVAVETQILKADPSSQGDSSTELAKSQVTNLQTPAIETQILKADPSSQGDSSPELAKSQVINLQTPAVAVETQILKADPSSHGDSNTELANLQVINLQTPAVAVETGKQSSI